MSIDQRIGYAGVVLGLLAIAIPILWPDKKWIGWFCLFGAFALLGVWGWLEFGAKAVTSFGQSPLKMGTFIFFAGGTVSVALWMLITSVRAPQGTIESAKVEKRPSLESTPPPATRAESKPPAKQEPQTEKKFYRPPAVHHPQKQTPQSETANLPHPVITLHHTDVSHDDQSRTITSKIIVWNTSPFDTTAELECSVRWKGYVIGPVTKRTIAFPGASAASQTGFVNTVSNTTTLSEMDYQLFLKGDPLDIELTILYPDRNGNTKFNLVGLITAQNNTVDITKTDWEPVR